MAALVVLAAGLSVHAADPPGQALPARLDAGQVRALVDRYTAEYGIPQYAAAIAKVVHMESRGFTAVRSKNGRYVGMCQFMPHTFAVNVAAMKKAGLLPADQTFSPLNPEHAVQVMVWMWSQGLHRQWGPARRMKIDPIGPIDLAINRNGAADAIEPSEKPVAESANTPLSSTGRAIPASSSDRGMNPPVQGLPSGAPLHGHSPMEARPSLGAPSASGSGAPESRTGPSSARSAAVSPGAPYEPYLMTSRFGLTTSTP